MADSSKLLKWEKINLALNSAGLFVGLGAFGFIWDMHTVQTTQVQEILNLSGRVSENRLFIDGLRQDFKEMNGALSSTITNVSLLAASVSDLKQQK